MMLKCEGLALFGASLRRSILLIVGESKTLVSTSVTRAVPWSSSGVPPAPFFF